MTSLKTSIKTITYLSDIGCLEIQGASLLAMKDYLVGGHSRKEVCEKYQMNNGYFSTTLGRLIRLNALAARLAPYYTDESSAFD